MAKITPQKITRWSAWIVKAKELKDKYENVKGLLFNNLIESQPQMFGRYDYKRSLVLLYLLYKVVNSQELLYHRFVNGSKMFLSETNNEKNKEIVALLKSVQEQGEELWEIVKKEKKSLTSVSEYFKGIDEKLAKTIISSGKFSEQEVINNQKEIGNISKGGIKEIKLVHQLAIKERRKEVKLLKKMEKIGRLKIIVMKVMRDRRLVFGASAVYVAGYLGFIFCGLDYATFNEVTNLARRYIAISSDNIGLAF